MKDYQKEAIEQGEAYNPKLNPEITREAWEEGIGFMRDVFDDIDSTIDGCVAHYKEDDCVFYGDLKSTIYNYQARNMSHYLSILLQKFKKELHEN